MEWSRRARATGLFILSLFIIWHMVGIAIVGPFDRSFMRDGLMKVYQPYLATFHLNQSWPFYAPNPFPGSILNYQTISSAGEAETYPLTQARAKFNHAYFRYTNFYAYLFSDPEYTRKKGYDKSVANYLCSKHQNQDVVSVKFILLNQKMFTRDDYLAGKRPLDKEFLRESVFGPYSCPLPSEATS